MQTIISLLASTSFLIASCRANAVTSGPRARDIVEISFPRLVSRRLAGLDAESAANALIFPTDYEALFRTLSTIVHLLGVSVIAYCLALRTGTDRLSAKGFISMPLSRWLVIIIFIDSWAFMFGSGILVQGVGLSFSLQACTAGIFLCICLYAVSKLLIYLFLVEKVYLVHPHYTHTRFRSPVYRICITFVVGYAVIIALAISGRIAYIRNGNPPMRNVHIAHGTDGACVIGLGRIASLSLLIYDLALNIFFTGMFLYPIYRTNNLSQRLRWIAKRTLVAATVSLITSALNVLVLTWFHGQELGWICLASCGMDVIVNAIAIFFVTASVYDGAESNNNSVVQKQNPGIITTRGILEVDDRDRPAAGERSNQTRSVHFSPDSTLATRFDRTLCTTLGVVTEKELEEGEGGKGGKAATGKAVEGKTQPSQQYPPVRADQNVRRARPASGQILVSRLGQTIPVEQADQFDASNYASLAYSFSNDYPRPGTPEDTTLEVRKEFTKRTWDPTIRPSKPEKTISNSNPNPTPDTNANANLNSESNPTPRIKHPRSRSGSLSSSETATPASPPPSSATHVGHMANMPNLNAHVNAKRRRLSLTTNESHDTILLNSSNFTPTPGATPTSSRFPSAIPRSLTSTPTPSNFNNPISSTSTPPLLAQRLSPSPQESSSTLGTPRTRPLSTILAEPDPEEIRERLSVRSAVTEAIDKPSKAAKIVNVASLAMGRSSSQGGRKRSNTDSDALGPPTLEVSVVMETTRKVEQRTATSSGKSRSRDGRERRERRSRESSMILDDYHGTTYNRGRSYSSSGGL